MEALLSLIVYPLWTSELHITQLCQTRYAWAVFVICVTARSINGHPHGTLVIVHNLWQLAAALLEQVNLTCVLLKPGRYGAMIGQWHSFQT